jgi:hypothetical protein
LLDSEDKRSDCAALGLGLISSETNQYNGEKLIHSVELHTHQNTDIREDILSKASNLIVGVGHCCDQLNDVVFK